jgi:hypothetical protein
MGITYPQRVVAIAGSPVQDRSAYNAALANARIGSAIQVTTELPDGRRTIYPAVTLTHFSTADLVQYFWVPYLVGLVYLVVGMWVYRQRKESPPALGFTFLCVNIAVVIGLLFGLYTSRFTSYLWTVAMAEVGAMLIAVSLLFPEELGSSRVNGWLRILAHTVALSLAMWGLVALSNPEQPWGYVIPWRYIYYYAAIGVAFFIGMMGFRQISHLSLVTKQQARVILWGSSLAFTPVALWFLQPLVGLSSQWNPLVFLPILLVFPILFTVAIFRYHIWNLDVIINRTLVYGLLTIILGLIYFSSVILLQTLFTALSGQRSTLVNVVSTILIAMIFAPLRRYIQTIIDRRFYRHKYDAQRALETFGNALRHEVELERLTNALLAVVNESMQPEKVSLWLCSTYTSSKSLPPLHAVSHISDEERKGKENNNQ